MDYPRVRRRPLRTSSNGSTTREVQAECPHDGRNIITLRRARRRSALQLRFHALPMTRPFGCPAPVPPGSVSQEARTPAPLSGIGEAPRLLKRPFGRLYETGGMRRTHLRGHTNILKTPADSRCRLQSGPGDAGFARSRNSAGPPGWCEGLLGPAHELHRLAGRRPLEPVLEPAPTTRVQTHLRGGQKRLSPRAAGAS